VRARAVIEKIYTSAPAQGYSAPTFDEYAIVRFSTLRRIAHAHVLLAANCTAAVINMFTA
jgi:hypothetical protein